MQAEAAGRRFPAVMLWGALAILIWAALTALLGGGQARADDDDPKPLSGLTSLVGDTVTDVVDPVVKTAADVVTDVASPVVDVAQQVVEKTAKTVATVPVVGTPASDALSGASQAVSTVTDTVTDVVSSSPVSSIVNPVTDVVRDVPIVGAVVDGLGATDILDDSATAVDGVVGTLTPVVDSTVPPIVEALDPDAPSDGTVIDPDVDVVPAPETHADASLLVPSALASDLTAVDTTRFATPWPVALAQLVASTPTASSGTAGDPPGMPTSAPPPGLAPASSSAGPGGSAGGSNAALHHLEVHVDATWTTAGLPADCALPPSPAGSTDVSPD